MGWLEDKIATWGRSIEAYAGPAARADVLQGCAALNDASPEERAAWSRGAMARLAAAVPDEKARAAIMTERGCVFVEEFGAAPLEELRALFRARGSVDEVLAAMTADPAGHGRSRRDGDVIYETKAPADADVYRAARTPREKQVAGCYCPLARAAAPPVPPPYCCCGGGWYKGIWEFILERPVRAEVAASIMEGDEGCVFRLCLPADAASGGPASGSKPRGSGGQLKGERRRVAAWPLRAAALRHSLISDADGYM
jgi:hypothetical protein